MSAERAPMGEYQHSTTLRKAWEDALPRLAEQIPTAAYASYIRPICPLSFEQQVVTLGVESNFAREWVDKRYSRHIRAALQCALGCEVDVRVRILSPKELTLFTEAAEAVVHARTEPPAEKRLVPIPSSKTAPKPAEERSQPLNERYTFDTFIVGKCNRLAHAGASAVAGDPGAVYNPLFVYGGPGVGKTHLLHSIGHEAVRLNPGLRVAFIDGENFTYHYVTALRERKIEEFRRHFRRVDLWLVDDIQFIASKEQTKEEFFHTFNALYQGGKQIVIASDRCPKDLRAMDERLRSRFECGLIADIAAPELETRMAIVERRCAAEEWDVSPEVVYFIASGVQTNIRSLEGALTKLVAYASIMKCPLTIDLAQEVLGDFIIERPAAGSSRKSVTMETILAAVAEQFGTNVETLRSERRDKAAVVARQTAMYLCREITGSGLAQIGEILGGRDHTTIQRGIARLDSLLAGDSQLAANLEETRRKLDR